MSDYDWSQFKRSIFINATPDRVFDAWIIPEQIETWFLQKAVFVRSDGSERSREEVISTGDNYAWNWWNYDSTEHGDIYLVDQEHHRLEFSFAGSCKVIVTVDSVAGDTRLSLVQEEIPLDEDSKRNIHVGCGQGWSFWMVNLKAWIEHGILLNDKESTHKTADYSFCELVNR